MLYTGRLVNNEAMQSQTFDELQKLLIHIIIILYNTITDIIVAPRKYCNKLPATYSLKAVQTTRDYYHTFKRRSDEFGKKK